MLDNRRILLADDQPLVRAGLRELLTEHSPSIAVGEAPNGADVMAQAQAAEWDAVILDVSLPDTSGVQVLRALRQLRPALPVLMFTLNASPTYVRECLKTGAAGFLSKESAPDELIPALRAVLGGETYVSRNFQIDAAG